MKHRLIGIFGVSALALASTTCEVPTEPASSWTCTVTLEAETFSARYSGSATASAATRDAAESAAQRALCGDSRLDLSASDRARCEQFGTAPTGFIRWRLESSCTTDSTAPGGGATTSRLKEYPL